MASSISDGPLLPGEVEPDRGVPRWTSLGGLAVVLAGLTLVNALHPTMPHLGGTPAPYALGEPGFGSLSAILPPAAPTAPARVAPAAPATPGPAAHAVRHSAPLRAGRSVRAAPPARHVPPPPPGPRVASVRVAARYVAVPPVGVTAVHGRGRGHTRTARPAKAPHTR